VVQFDQLSIFHVGLVALIASVWFLLWQFDTHSRAAARTGPRLLALAGGGALVLAAVGLTFPRFFQGPFVDVDPRVVSIWLQKVGEVTPLVDLKKGLTVTTMALAFPAVAGFAGALYLTLRERRSRCREWLFLLGSILAFTAAAQEELRWISYVEILFPIVAAEMVTRLVGILAPRVRGAYLTLARGLAVAGLCVLFLSLDQFLKPFLPPDPPVRPMNVSLSRLCDHLNHTIPGPRPRRILTHIFSGPQLLYCTPHEVIGTPYHRNTAGILFTYEVMTAATDAEACRLLRERRIDYILLCPETNENDIYERPGAASTFYQRLLHNELPVWLQPLPLPKELSSSFKLFQVTAAGSDGSTPPLAGE
jgi:hypothetical protein